MNSIIVSGRLVRDWESRKAKDVDLYINSIAVQRDYKENGEYQSDFFDVKAFSNVGSYLSKYSKKGDLVILQGTANINSYVDKDGIGRKAFSIKVLKANCLTSAEKSQNEGEFVDDPSFNGDDDIPF